MRHLALAVLLVFGLAEPAWAGFQDGKAAFDQGDYAKAFGEWLPLAEQGDPRAQHWISHLYLFGQGVPKDLGKSNEWLLKSASQDHAQAQLSLCSRAWNEKAYDRALASCRRAADKGFSLAQFLMGRLHQQGLAVQLDYVEAVAWYRRAAEQSNASAQFNLGLMYAKGQGVSQDYTQAVKWYRCAAEQGDAKALHNLGFMYAMGHGVPRDYVQAHKWYSLATSRLPAGGNRVRAARNRDIAEARLTPTHVAKAQRLAREWKPKAQRDELRNTVRAIQGSLAAIGYDPGPPDGILGPRTRVAIRAFQRDHDLAVTGEASGEPDFRDRTELEAELIQRLGKNSEGGNATR